MAKIQPRDRFVHRRPFFSFVQWHPSFSFVQRRRLVVEIRGQSGQRGWLGRHGASGAHPTGGCSKALVAGDEGERKGIVFLFLWPVHKHMGS